MDNDDDFVKALTAAAVAERDEYLVSTSPTVQRMDEDIAGIERAAMAKRQQAARDALRGTRAELEGPSQDMYDYTAAYANAVDFSTDVLPNKYEQPRARMVQGYDAADLHHIMRPEHWRSSPESDALEMAGLQELRESSRTVDGVAPDTDVPTLAKLASSAMLQGAQSHNEWRSVLGASGHTLAATELAWEAAERAALRDDLEVYIELNINSQPDLGAITETPSLEETVLGPEVSEEALLDAAGRWYQHREGAAFKGSPAELTDYAMEEISAFNWNTKNMAEFVVDLMATDDPELAQAFMTMMDASDRAPITWEGTGRALGNVVTDPFVYAGIGAGTVAFKAMQKAAARRAIRPLIAQAVAGSAVAGVEGGLLTMAGEAAQQSVEITADVREDYDAIDLGVAGVAGGALGSVLGATGALAPAAVQRGREIVTRARAGRMR